MMKRTWSQIRRAKLFNEHSERGAVLIITALLLVVLIGFAALAVDLSALFVERRHAQTAADVGALSGAQFAGVDANAAVARQAVVDEVISLTANNLDSTDWSACSDPDRLTDGFTYVSPTTDCVSFTFGLSKIRVRVPDQTFNTFFAGVLGVATLTANAAAEVTGEVHTSGDIFPFGIPSGDADETLGCPSDHPNGLYPCDGPDSGNFNRLQATQWGINPPPDHDCTHSNGMFEDNLAAGLDHLLGIYNLTTNTLEDIDACNDPDLANFANPPGTVQSATGVAQSVLAPGLITGSAGGFDGRLTDTTNSTKTESVLGETLDNDPLWSFIDNYPIGGPLSGIPTHCQGPSFTGTDLADWDEDLWVALGLDPRTSDPDFDGGDPLNPLNTSYLEPAASFEHMARCLREYRDGEWSVGPIGYPSYAGAKYDAASKGTGVLFDRSAYDPDTAMGIYDLQRSPRWGWSPVGEFFDGTNPFKIEEFVPIFIQSLVSECSAVSCNWIWHAGQDADGNPGGNKISSLISFQIPELSVHPDVFDYGPGGELVVPYSLTK